jgi:hypothetical protein
LMYPFLLIIIYKLCYRCPRGEDQVIAVNKAHRHRKTVPQKKNQAVHVAPRPLGQSRNSTRRATNPIGPADTADEKSM